MPQLNTQTFLSAAFLVFAILAINTFQPFKRAAFDTYQLHLAPPVEFDSDAVFVDIDDKSLAQLGQWPWPRNQIADLLLHLYESGVSAVGVDFLFPEPDRSSPINILAQLPDQTRDDAGLALQNPYGYLDWDAYFGDLLAQTPTSMAITAGDQPAPKDWPGAWAVLGTGPTDYLPQAAGLLMPTPTLAQNTQSFGYIGVGAQDDGLIRELPLVLAQGDQIIASLSVELARLNAGANTLVLTGNQSGIAGLRVGPTSIPTDIHGRVRLAPAAFQDIPVYSAVDVLNELHTQDLANKTVVLGSGAAGLKDQHDALWGTSIAGPKFHVALLRQINAQHWPAEFAPNLGWWSAALIAALALLVVGMKLPVIASLAAALPVAAFPLAASAAHFHQTNQLIYTLDLSVGWGLALLVPGLIKAINQEKDKAATRAAFSSYLSPDLVNEVIANPDSLKLGGETRELTIMFADIHGFTTLSENLKDDPERLTHLINRLLSPLTEVVLESGGTIDKYMGDCVMAFWNAPLPVEQHQRKATQAAQSMLARLDDLNAELNISDVSEKPLRIGIGINTGSVVVGNFGSDQRFDYSCLGDPANLAARLEAMCRTYDVDILLGPDTAVDQSGLIEVDQVVVKGKTDAVTIYTVAADLDAPSRTMHQEFLAAYRAQQWSRCDALLAPLSQIGAYPQGLIRTYRARVDDLRQQDLPKDWDGIFVSKTK